MKHLPDNLFKPKNIAPTDEQLAIQQSREVHLIVEAAAGAAKTTTLALRLAQALHRGASPQTLLVLTFTEPAVQAMHDKLQLVGIPAGIRAKLRICTFENFSRQVLRRYEAANVPVHETPEQLRPSALTAIERVLQNSNERHRDTLYIPGSGDAVVESYLNSFLRLKGAMQMVLQGGDCAVSPSLADELGLDYTMLKVFFAYERERKGGHPDHPRFRASGDATYDLARLLIQDDEPALREQLRAPGFNFVALDEMHDTNRAMFTVLRAVLQENPQSVFVGVGDRDQVIHALFGARAEFMGESFDQEIARAQRLPLSASYRFGPLLAKAAGRVSGRKKYTSRADRTTVIAALHCSCRQGEYKAILEAALQRRELPGKAAMSELAVLLRHPHQSIGVENLLIKYEVPYLIRGMQSYLFRPEILLVRVLLAYATDNFHAIQSVETRREAARSLLLFGGGKLEVFGRECEEQQDLQREALASVAENPRLLTAFFENQVLRNGSKEAQTLMPAAVEVARTHSGPGMLGEFIRKLSPQKLAAKVLVSSERVRQVQGNLEGLLASADTYEGAADFFMALNDFEVRREGLKTKDCLVLSSIEAAKGLEYDHVVLPFMNPGEFATSDHKDDDRNLFYVGITRAKSELTLLWHAECPSQFVVDAGVVSALTAPA